MGEPFTGSRILVIGYGNPLRRDDGIGPYVARRIEQRGLPGVRTLAVHQLTPELAEPLSAAIAAIFVDARLGAGRQPVEISPVNAGDAQMPMTHSCDPRFLLQLAHAVYGCAPRAWVVSVTGNDFGLGEGLSEPGQCDADAAETCIGELLQNVLSTSKRP